MNHGLQMNDTKSNDCKNKNTKSKDCRIKDNISKDCRIKDNKSKECKINDIKSMDNQGFLPDFQSQFLFQNSTLMLAAPSSQHFVGRVQDGRAATPHTQVPPPTQGGRANYRPPTLGAGV